MSGPAPTLPQALNRALSAFKAGKFVEAEEQCRQIVAANPDFFEAIHILAVVQASLGKNDLALASYDRALALRPADAGVLNNRGVTLQKLNRHDEALASYDRALALREDNAAVFYNRGNALRELRRFDEALASYDRALALRPDHARALNNRGIALRDLGRHDEALANYERALASRPNDAESHNNMGAALKELGRLDEARDYFEKAIRLAPRTPLVYLSLATSKQFTADDPHLAAMQALAGEMASLGADDAISLHFALGKALADVGRHEESFHHLLQGNALKRTRIAYDEAATLRMLERVRTVFTPALMRSKHGLGDPSETPVFILGMPRSGSTLVEQILASHPKVFGAGELDHFAAAVARRHPPVPFPEGIADVADDRLRRFGTDYLDATTRLAPGAARITDKTPLNFGFAGLIHLALPHARIVHTRRDPVDTCLSCFSTLFATGQPFTYDLGELGRYYRAYDVLMRHWRDVLPEGVMIEVQYEDVVDDLEGQARRLVAHCGLDWDEACLDFHRTERTVRTASAVQVRQPIYRGSVARRRPANDLLRPLLDGLEGSRPDMQTDTGPGDHGPPR
jgi:tetratricopeptide (TPR) repeat protein